MFRAGYDVINNFGDLFLFPYACLVQTQISGWGKGSISFFLLLLFSFPSPSGKLGSCTSYIHKFWNGRGGEESVKIWKMSKSEFLGLNFYENQALEFPTDPSSAFERSQKIFRGFFFRGTYRKLYLELVKNSQFFWHFKKKLIESFNSWRIFEEHLQFL